MPKSVTHLNWAPIYEWYVVRCGSTNRHHKAMSLQEIGLSAQILLTILGSIVRISEEGGEGLGATWSFYGSNTFDFEES